MKNDPHTAEMTIIEHLDELRKRIIYSGVAVIAGFIVCFIFSRPLLALILDTAESNITFIQISPGEVFITSLKTALYGGFYLASPVIFYQVIKFTAPGLTKKEKRYLFPIIAMAFVLFTVGALLGYYLVVPLGVRFLLDYGAEIAHNTISVAKYFGVVSAIIILMGVVFQIPLLLAFLSLLQIVHSGQLLAVWQYVVVGAFVVGAVLTPSIDPFVQSIVAIAILGLYFMSIGVLKILKR